MPSDYIKQGIVVKKGLISEVLVTHLRKYFAMLVENDAPWLFYKDSLFEDGGVPMVYGDPNFDILMSDVTSTIENIVGKKLNPQYTYARAYPRNSILRRHTDRISCEHSLSLALGGDKWPIHIKDRDGKTHNVLLDPGDALVYDGVNLEHWREPLDGDVCYQVFMHWNDSNGEWKDQIFDGRPNLGLPRSAASIPVDYKLPLSFI